MAKKRGVEGTQRRDMYVFQGEEIDKLECTPQVRYKEIDDDHVQSMVSVLATGGVLPPVHIIVDTITGVPKLFDGRHRRRAHQVINNDPSHGGLPGPVALEAVAKALDEAKAFEMAVQMNDGLPLSLVDQSKIIRWCDNISMPRAATAKLLGITQAQAACREKYMDLPEDFRDALHKGQQAESTAKALVEARKEKFTDKTVWESVATSIVQGDMKPHELRKMVNDEKRDSGRAVARGIGELRGLLKGSKSVRARLLQAYLQGDPSVTEDDMEDVLSDRTLSRKAPEVKERPKRRVAKPVPPPDPDTVEPIDDDDDDGGDYDNDSYDTDPDVKANGALLDQVTEGL